MGPTRRKSGLGRLCGQDKWQNVMSAHERKTSRRGWLVLRTCAWACLFSDLAILPKSSFQNFIYQFLSLSIHLSIHILICLYRSICERNNSNNNAGTTHHANLLFAVPYTAICNIQYVHNYQLTQNHCLILIVQFSCPFCLKCDKLLRL